MLYGKKFAEGGLGWRPVEPFEAKMARVGAIRLRPTLVSCKYTYIPITVTISCKPVQRLGVRISRELVITSLTGDGAIASNGQLNVNDSIQSINGTPARASNLRALLSKPRYECSTFVIGAKLIQPFFFCSQMELPLILHKPQEQFS